MEIKIYKSSRALQVWEGEQKTREFKVGLGFSPEGEKHRDGDGRTPEGEYYICTKNPESKFTLFLGLSYPDIKDARYGLENGFLTQEDYDMIEKSISEGKRPPWETSAGGKVGIHGKGSTRDWTAGCVALADEDIKTLWDIVELGTKVSIYP